MKYSFSLLSPLKTCFWTISWETGYGPDQSPSTLPVFNLNLVLNSGSGLILDQWN